MPDLSMPPVDGRPAFRPDPGWRAVVAAFTLNGLLFGAWAARVPNFKEALSLEPAMLGLLLLALAGGAITAFPLAGAMSERLGASRLSVLLATFYCPALIGLALAPTPLLLGVALFVFGALHGSLDVAMNGWAARVETRMNRPTMSIFHAMFSLGAGLGAASGYVAVQLGLAPLPHFLLIALIGGAVALWQMVPAADPPPALTGARRVRGRLLAIPSGRLALVGLVAFAVSMGEGAMADWSAVFLKRLSGVTEAQAALAYAAFSATMVLTRLSGGYLVQWMGPVRVTKASGVTAFVGLVVVIISGSLALSLLGFALIGIGYAVVMPLVFSRAASDPTMPPGPAIASVATVGYGGMLLGPPVVGFVAQLAGLQAAFGMLALLALGAVLLAPVLRIDP